MKPAHIFQIALGVFSLFAGYSVGTTVYNKFLKGKV